MQSLIILIKHTKVFFSFDVLGLQDIHRNLNETQLQSYLLEAGALGSTEFGHMGEVISQKKELYKNRGKIQF